MSRKVEIALDCALLAAPFLTAFFFFLPLEAYPANDDFLFGRSARILYEEGRWQLVSYNTQLLPFAASTIGLGALFCRVAGFSYIALHLSVLLLGWLGAVAVYSGGRTVGVGRGRSLLAAVALAACPWYFGHSYTFMTDVPASAWSLLAMSAYLRGAVGRSNLWLFAGSAAALLAVWSRQTALGVIFLPIICEVCLRRAERSSLQRSAWRILAAVGLPALGICLLELQLFGPGNLPRAAFAVNRPLEWSSVKTLLTNAYGVTLVVGFGLLPMAPLWAAGGINISPRIVAATCLGSIPLVVFISGGGGATLTNASGPFLHNAHFGPILVSDCFEPGRWGDMGGVVWPEGVWIAITLVAAANFLLLIVRASESFSLASSVAEPAVWCEAGLLAVAAACGSVLLLLMGFYFDRYWLTVLTPLFLWTIARARRNPPTRPHVYVSTVLVGAMLALSIVFTHDYLAWNQARWRLVKMYKDQQFRPEQIDGGYEVNGWFRSAENPATPPRAGDDSRWWSGRAERFITVGPRPGMEVDARQSWSCWAMGGERFVLGLRKSP